MKIKISKFQIGLYIILAIILFYFIGYPSLTGDISIQAYSDAKTYERVALLINSLSDALFSTEVSQNLAGPLLILKLLNSNYLLIFIFNVVCLLVSIKVIFDNYKINRKVFLFFIFINPMTLFALFSVNKEILAFLSIAIYLAYIKNKNIKYFIIALLVAFLARWQLLLFVIVSSVLVYLDTHIKQKKLFRYLIIILLLVIISLIFPLFTTLFSKVLEYSDSSEVTGTGIFQRMNDLQLEYGGYILVFIPKLLQILFGLLLSRYRLITDFSDFWNNVVQYFNSASFFVLSLYLLYKRKINIKYVNLYLAVIYCLIFTLTVIFSPRYFFGLYLILALLASEFSYRKNSANVKVSVS
ncbi:MAG: hypothetical protein WCK35_22650 [Chloroflexota bacterium]